MAITPTKPTKPPKASRLDRDTFNSRADPTVDYMFDAVPDYVEDGITFIDGRANDALAAALGGDLPPITGKGGQFLRVNAGETAAEFAPVDLTKATEAQAEAGTGTGLMDPVLTKAAIDAQFNVSGAAPKFACRAWVNFNGTGTVAIRASGNVSSITDNGTGDYTVNFTTAMPDANYCWTGSAGDQANANRLTLNAGANYSATISSLRVRATMRDGYSDVSVANVAVFR